jgi:hypothetical protein
LLLFLAFDGFQTCFFGVGATRDRLKFYRDFHMASQADGSPKVSAITRAFEAAVRQ